MVRAPGLESYLEVSCSYILAELEMKHGMTQPPPNASNVPSEAHRKPLNAQDRAL